MKILLVEDDSLTRDLLTLHLTAARYTVEQAVDGTTALDLAVLWDYDLIVLDLNIPQLDGLSLCRQLRTQSITTPILILTAQTGDDSLVTGLDAGADDYVTKPFEVQGVLARIRALLRRGTTATTMPSLVWGKLALNPALAQVTYEGQVVPLTPKEYSLLELFLRHPQRVFSRSNILDHLWTIDDSPTEGAVTNLVKDLRNRLKRSGVTETVIQTVYGLGYRLRERPSSSMAPVPLGTTADPPESQDMASSTVAPPPTAPLPSPAPSPAPSQTPEATPASATLAQINQRFRASLQGRLAVLESALQSLRASTLTPQQRQAAREEAHRLAGGLGTFGNLQGSVQAHQIEQLLQQEPPFSPDQGADLARLIQALRRTLQPETAPVPDSMSPEAKASGCRLLAIQVEPMLLEQLRGAMAQRGWSVAVASPDVDLGAQSLDSIDGVILTLDQRLPLATKLEPLRQIRSHYPYLPVLVLTTEDSLEDRVQVAQLRGDRYLANPIALPQVMEALDQVLPCARPPDPRVMVVDSDPIAQTTIAELLTPWGMGVQTLGNSRQFWERLRTTQPDLLLLELDLPTFSGLDLCRVVRQDPQYGSLPILMLAANPDTFTVHQVFEAGGDDLIGKPIVGPELVTRVLSRIERSRLRQQLEQMRHTQSLDWGQSSHQDALTQIPNRLHFQTFLQQQWDRHCQDQAPLSLILAEVDDFEIYRQVYGQAAGESVLWRIARTLQRTVNSHIDLIARYGEQEFSVVLPNTNLDGALRVGIRIQEMMAQMGIVHGACAQRSQFTLSLGIGGTIPQAQLAIPILVTTTHQALQEAKSRGGNTFCLYPIGPTFG